MADEQQGRRSFWGTIFAIIGGAFRLAFVGIAAWWRWAGQRTTTRGKVLAFGGPVAVLLVIIIAASAASGSGGGGSGDSNQVPARPTETARATKAAPTTAPSVAPINTLPAATATQPPAPTDTPVPPAPTQPPVQEQPTQPPVQQGPPAGATALCVDGTYSFSAHRSGTCSHHGGVAQWINKPPN